MFCDITSPTGNPSSATRARCSSATCGRPDMGFTFFVAPEIEYFYFADSGPEPKVLDRGGYFDLTPLDVAQEYRRKTINALEKMGIPIEHSHHEVAPSQHEIIVRYTDALTMADNIMSFRLTVKEVALEHGIYATFMPKPLEAHDGSGMHFHMSLFEDDRNAFADDGGRQLSKTGQQFVAGLLTHAREITAVTNQWVNSYKRLVRGFDAPIWVSWGYNNQSALVRVPTVKANKPSSVRVEYRSPGCGHQPLPGAVGAARGRSAGYRTGLRAPAGGSRERARDVVGRTPGRRHRASAGDALRGARPPRILRARRETRSATTCSAGSSATSGTSGTGTSTTSRASSSTPTSHPLTP
jgi:glutamine synthetase